MNRLNKIVILVASLCLISGILFWHSKQPIDPSASDDPVSTPRRTEPTERLVTQVNRFELPPKAQLSPLPTHPEADSIGHPQVSPIAEIAALSKILTAYSESMGALPTAESNALVMAQLRGANTAKRAWFPREHIRLNTNDELLDTYDTPYFFHFESSHQVTLRSAGPDRELYTVDDLIHKLVR